MALGVGNLVALICIVIIIFAVKYRRRSNNQHTPVITEGDDPRLEIVWTVIPFIFIMIFFVWGARLFFITFHPPADALQISVVGKQWMWKVQHPEGAREIDELHVPLGQPVKLLLTSQDVIHDFFVPAFRIKTDVVPGRYTTFWFEASKAGEYRLVCSQYCGTQHSGMIGRVVVMTASGGQAELLLDVARGTFVDKDGMTQPVPAPRFSRTEASRPTFMVVTSPMRPSPSAIVPAIRFPTWRSCFG